MNDRQRVVPHILRKDIGTTSEQIAIACVDGVDALVVPISEESARWTRSRCARFSSFVCEGSPVSATDSGSGFSVKPDARAASWTRASGRAVR